MPRADTARAMPLGIPNARFYADGDTNLMIQEGMRALQREMTALRAEGKNPTRTRLPPVYYLAVSGGGDDGAFGAGLLNGWSETGTRPEFKMVTGVSTGALIAPFAFLGPSYDAALREVYTTMTPDSIFRDALSLPRCSTTPWPTRLRLPPSSPSMPMRDVRSDRPRISAKDACC